MMLGRFYEVHRNETLTFVTLTLLDPLFDSFEHFEQTSNFSSLFRLRNFRNLSLIILRAWIFCES